MVCWQASARPAYLTIYQRSLKIYPSGKIGTPVAPTPASPAAECRRRLWPRAHAPRPKKPRTEFPNPHQASVGVTQGYRNGRSRAKWRGRAVVQSTEPQKSVSALRASIPQGVTRRFVQNCTLTGWARPCRPWRRSRGGAGTGNPMMCHQKAAAIRRRLVFKPADFIRLSA